jgi:hypothetical protein
MKLIGIVVGAALLTAAPFSMHSEPKKAGLDAAIATFLFCTLPDELQVAGMRELGRVVKPSGIIRCLEYTRPSGGIRRTMTRLWEPWVYWAYGASFDRQTERQAPAAGLTLFESRFVHDELIKLLGARA